MPIDLRKAPIGSAEFVAECMRISQLALEEKTRPFRKEIAATD
jgi:hypothetical protein